MSGILPVVLELFAGPTVKQVLNIATGGFARVTAVTCCGKETGTKAKRRLEEAGLAKMDSC